MAERQFGPYRLVRQIAVGGMAEIHLAKAAGIAGFEKYVALKMIHPNFAADDQFIQMLVDEAKIAVQLTHGNIAQTFDLGRVGETYYITMEYVDGADLYKILRRASEQDLEMPLDVCAFIGKEISSALDHAHRKRDHTGKSLGIVHRDVSPQNVLVSYSGEVKLVDFGIAKATMKVRQTAVGVIKGKYYYMSPEQAWGDPIDHRSDIFSAGIVLYEMITGQMMYLEEDLHKLLEMARSADIAPPSKLRRGVPPQLERIVMHALEKVPGERYQSAGDLATDLERFLHAYSPVFTASKLSTLLRQVVGEPVQVPDDSSESIEFRDGVMSTHPLDDAEVAHAIDRSELRDENSVIFRVSELARPRPNASRPPTPRPSAPPPTPPPTPRPVRASTPRLSAPRITRAADPLPLPARPVVTAKLPSIARPSTAKIPQIVKPREPHEDTRRLDTPAPADPLQEDSGLLLPDGQRWTDVNGPDPDTDLDNIGERTVITGAPRMAGFMIDGDDAVENTLVTAMPTGFNGEDEPTTERHDDDVPTVSREFAVDNPTMPARPKLKVDSPAALAANIHAPAVSELRKPRASRRTPAGGNAPNVLHQIVAAQVNEPMPAPRPMPGVPIPPPMPPPLPMSGAMAAADMPTMAAPPPGLPHNHAMPQNHAMPTQLEPDPHAGFPVGTPGGQPPYSADASGLPIGLPTPPGMTPLAVHGVPAHLQPYANIQGIAPGYGNPQPPTQMSPHGYPQLTPGALYPFPAPQPQEMSLTGQMRLFEADELPSQYRLLSSRRRWFTYILAGAAAISVAAAITFLIIRSMRETGPQVGSVHIDSVPGEADVLFDGTRLPDKTPLTIDGAQVGTRHQIRVELARHKPYDEMIEIPRNGKEISVMAYLKPITGKINVDSTPSNAEVYLNGQPRGRTPAVINDVDMDSVNRLEVRLKDYQPLVMEKKDLVWSADGRINVSAKLSR